ncbi:MAG: hypothetical protein EU530_00735 [Promethearchaeota archaeon]|nr:MAG: hypothetical protein EU530_00735 [Candidatus Lokiarchaeota archaeon]
MSSKIQTVSKIITIHEYLDHAEEYQHLFEICLQPPDNITWQIHDEFVFAGTAFLGDLNLHEQETENIEIHPFPEWVIKIFQPNKKPGKAYAIFPLLPKKFIQNTLPRKNFSTRIQKIQEKINSLTADEIVAVEYQDGVCIKVPENVPHYFLSVVEKGEDVPYLQVFEPRIDFIKSHMGFDTPYFQLPFKLKVK